MNITENVNAGRVTRIVLLPAAIFIISLNNILEDKTVNNEPKNKDAIRNNMRYSFFILLYLLICVIDVRIF